MAKGRDMTEVLSSASTLQKVRVQDYEPGTFTFIQVDVTYTVVGA